MLFNELQVLPPKSWEKFEDLCLDLFATEWSDPTAQKNGRRGQPQHRTDIWGLPAAAGGAHAGVQCKGKDSGYGAKLTETDLRAEVEKAKLFRPGLAHWILATTAPKDEHIEEISRTLTVEHLAAGSFRVQVLGWADLQNLLSNHIKVLEKYYPDQSPHIRWTLQRIEARLDLDDQEPALDFDKALAATRNAATADLKRFMRDVCPEHLIDLSLERASDCATEPIQRQHVIATLRSGSMHVLQAEPGAGKSTTLLQLAAEILSETMDLVPVLFRLLERGTGKTILDEIADRPPFKAAGETALAAVAQAGHVVVLCDGWNELSSEDRIAARIELDKHARNYPGGLLLATRALSPMPFPALIAAFHIAANARSATGDPNSSSREQGAGPVAARTSCTGSPRCPSNSPLSQRPRKDRRGRRLAAHQRGGRFAFHPKPRSGTATRRSPAPRIKGLSRGLSPWSGRPSDAGRRRGRR
jgi:hypothetical protein